MASISSILQNFLRYPLSCSSPKIYLQDLRKRFQFVLDQNLGHFEANLFDRAKIVMQAILCLSKMAKPDLITCNRHHLAHLLKYYPRPSCAPSFIKSRKLPNTINTFLTFLKFLVCIHAGDPRVPPRVLASGSKPCGGN